MYSRVTFAPPGMFASSRLTIPAIVTLLTRGTVLSDMHNFLWTKIVQSKVLIRSR